MIIRKYISILVLLTCAASSSGAELSKEQEYECLSLIAVLPVMANPRMQTLGDRAYEMGGSSLLMQQIRNLADEGVPEALYSLGVLYENGYCVPKDIEKGHSLYKEAARHGSQEAKERLRK
jgi:TPR repeat protein